MDRDSGVVGRIALTLKCSCFCFPKAAKSKLPPFLTLILELSFCYGVFSGRFLHEVCGGDDLDGSA